MIPLIFAALGVVCYLTIHLIVDALKALMWFVMVAGPLALAEFILGRDFAEYRERMRKLRNGRV